MFTATSKSSSATARRAPLAVATRRQKVLVAEDHAATRQIICATLARAGYDACAVADGESAWNELQMGQYDLLVTGHALPQLTGLNLIERMRTAGLQLPVILAADAFTGEALRENVRLGIAAVVSKPFGLLDFLNHVRRAVGTSDRLDPATVENPAAAPTRQPGVPARLAPPSHNRVLIADDDAVVRGSLVAVLQSEGFEVEEASNGIEAVTRAIKHKPDLVLLDLNMPHVDGWAAFNQLDRIAPLVPVIVITARPNQYPVAVRVGVDAFMEKPLNIPILVRAVRNLANETDDCHVRRITKRSFVTQLLGDPDPNTV